MLASSVPTIPPPTRSPPGLLPAIVKVSVTGSSRGAGGSGSTATPLLPKTCRSPSWATVLVSPSVSSAQIRTCEARTGVGSSKVR